MDRMKPILQQVMLLFLGALLLLSPDISCEAIWTGLQTCCRSVLPTLFPFIVLTRTWTGLGLQKSLQSFTQPLMRSVFHLPGAAAPWVLGTIGGYPVGAQVIAQLYQEHQITKEEASHALYFCCNAGPAFILGIVGANIFCSRNIGLVLQFIHLFSSILLGILFRPKTIPKQISHDNSCKQNQFLTSVTEAIASASETVLQICSYVLIFTLLSTHLKRFLPDNLLSSIILGSMELAGGTSMLAELSVPVQTKFVISAALLGWGGLCVHGQTVSILTKAKLPTAPYWKGKVLQAAISAGSALVICPFLSWDVPCMASGTASFFPYWTFLLFPMLLGKSFSGKKNEYPL